MIPDGLAFDECFRKIFSRVVMKSMKFVISIPMQPARVKSTSRMKFMRKSVSPRRHPHNVGVHNMLAGSSQIDFFDG